MPPGITFESQGAVAYTGRASGTVPSYDQVDVARQPPAGTVLFDGPLQPLNPGSGVAYTRGLAFLEAGASSQGFFLGPLAHQLPNGGGILTPGTRSSIKGSLSILDSTVKVGTLERWGIDIEFQGSSGSPFATSQGSRASHLIGVTSGGSGEGPLDDRSGNGRHLSNINASFEEMSDPVRYGGGWRVEDTNSVTEMAYHLGQSNDSNATSLLLGSMQQTIVFEVDAFFGATQSLFATVISHPTSFYYWQSVDILPDGRIQYKHRKSNGTYYTAASVATVGIGLHTLTMNRDNAARTIVIKVSGVTVINTSWVGADDPMQPALSGGNVGGFYMTWGGSGGGSFNSVLNGLIGEVRIWYGTLTSQAVLDEVVDPLDNTYRHTAQGNEWLLYYMDAPAGAGTFLTVNQGAGNAVYTDTGILAGSFIGWELIIEVPYLATLANQCLVTLRVTDALGVEHTLFDRVAPASNGAIPGTTTNFGVECLMNSNQRWDNLWGKVVVL